MMGEEFLVVGPGAMGCLFAARLKAAGYGVTLLDYSPERAGQISETGLSVEGVSGEANVSVPVITGGAIAPPDFVLICVKSHKTEEAGLKVRELLQGSPVVVTLQNGVGHVETLGKIFGRENVLGGVTSEGATVLGAGRIRHAGRGETYVGPAGESAERLARAFNRAGFKTECVEEVDGLIWGKLVVNVGINALTAVTRLRNGRLAEIHHTRRVMARAVEEAVAVSKAKGISLPYPDPMERVVSVCRATAGNVASMLQDVLNERVTEVDYINGAVVREGAALGVSTPVNEVLACLVRTIQETYAERM
ncbi:MAG: ketopantoate reductase family protein [Desulfobacteraceae bacterium]